MIYAKLDVCFHRHKRFRRAGPAAAGLWAAALTYLREEESLDGFIEDDEVACLLGVGEALGLELASKLVEVELFLRVKGGYVLLRYAEKNETKSDIEERRASTKQRVSAHRSRAPSPALRVSNALHDGTRNALHDGTRNALHDGTRNALHDGTRNALHDGTRNALHTTSEQVFVPGSDSVYGSGSDLSGSLGGAGGEAGATIPPPAPSATTAAPSGVQRMAPIEVSPIGPDVIGQCELAGYPIPTEADWRECVLWHRSQAKALVSPPETLVRWMGTKKRLHASARGHSWPSSKFVQPMGAGRSVSGWETGLEDAIAEKERSEGIR